MHKPNLFQTILTEDVMMEKTLREQLSTRGLKWLLVVFAWLLLPLGAWADDDFTLGYGSATGLESVTFAVDGTPATTAKANDVVTVTAKGVEGYAATAITATAGSGGSATQLTVTKVGGKFAQWTFTMPAEAVSITATMENVWGVSEQVDGSTKEKAFVITTTLGLDLLAEKVNSGTVFNYQGKYFKLGADITYDKNNLTIDNDNDGTNDSNYTPIGGYFGGNKHFCGTFDGGGHTVKGITIVRKGKTYGDELQGLFGILGADGTVSHVTLDQSSIKGYAYIGGIVGEKNGGNIIDCHVTASVSIIASQTDSWDLGGIAGDNSSGLIAGCTSAASIKGVNNSTDNLYFGGIAGLNYGTIKDCIYLGSEVGGVKYVGAITGDNFDASVTNCYYTDVNFVGKDISGNDVTLDNGNPAIGVSEDNVTETNVGLARAITLDGKVPISGTSTPYSPDGAAIALTAYAPKADDPGYALALTTGGESPTTTLYSMAGTNVVLVTGESYAVEVKVTATDGGDDVTSTVYANGTLTVPTYDVTVSAEDLWGIGQGADGSQEHPYVITTTLGLDLLAEKVNSGTVFNYQDKYFKLGADITYDKNNLTIDNDNDGTNDSNYTPIGGYFGGNKHFCGTFDGGGHTVKGITIVRNGDTDGDWYQGLFGILGADGTVSHVTLDESSITSYDCTGGIVGFNNGGNIIDCHVTASVSIIASQRDSGFFGGIAGYNSSGLIAGCTSAASIKGVNNSTGNLGFGGITGANDGTIKDCIYLGSEVGGVGYVGAITGYNFSASVTNCYYTDVNFVGKDDGGNYVTLGNGNPAIGDSYVNATVTNVGLARTITLGNNVAIDGTSTPYSPDGAAIALTAYAPKADDPGFALALTTGGESPTTTLYSTAGAKVVLGTGESYAVEVKVTATDGGDDVTSTVYANGTLTVPTYDVTVSAEDLWGIGQGADGSQEHPYVITTTAGLDLLAKKVSSGTRYNYQGKYFKLGADITYKDLTIDNDNDGTNDSNYTPIGGNFGFSKHFCGTFDGGGHTVKGITIVRKGKTDGDWFQGLFGYLGEGGTVSHVTLDESSIKVFSGIGGIVGNNNGGNIIDCHVTASVSIIASQSNSWYLGGIAGYNDSGLIAGCTSAASIKGVNNSTENLSFGGITGANRGTIKDCIYLGSEVGGNSDVGAITGDNFDASVTNCYYTDVNFVGKDISGNDVTLDNGNPAIGVSVGNVTETNVGLARTITLGNNVAIDGTSTPYGLDGAAIALTAYAPKADDPGFALALTTGGESPTTTLYSTAGANIKIGLQTTLSEGYVEAFTATKTSDGTDVTADVISDATLTTPTYDVKVSAEDLWGIGQGADGSQEHPYVITTTLGLDLLAKKVNSGTNYGGKYFKLGADITYKDLTIDNDNNGTNDSNYTPIGGHFGGSYKYFCGTFDGGGHTVKGITIVRKGKTDGDWYQGLFGYLGEGGSVSHVTLDESSITGYDCIGGIVGFNNGGNIIDCHVTASVSIIASQSNSWYLGGIAGYNSDGLIAGCTSTASIKGVNNSTDNLGFGGITGANDGTIKDCIYLGSEVGGNSDVGAITGDNFDASVTNCYYTDVNFVGKDISGNDVTLDNGNPAIGVSVGNVTETNVGLARTITLGNNVAIDGTSTPYGLDGAAIALTAYAPKADDPGFALALTTGGESPTTPLYSTAGTEVGIKYDGTLPTGVKPTFTVTKSQSGTVDVSETSGAYNFTMPSDDVTVSVLTGTTVSVAAQSWATYYGSQAVSLTDGQQDCALYTLSSVSTTAVTLSEISGVASKETPLLIWNGSDTARDILLSFTAEPASPTAHAPQFTGTVDGIQVGSITNGSVYVLYNNEFVKASGGRIGENRAFIVMPTGNAARQLIIGDATRIGTTDYPNEAGTWYSLDGRKLAGKPTRPGAYIVDGKKKVIINK